MPTDVSPVIFECQRASLICYVAVRTKTGTLPIFLLHKNREVSLNPVESLKRSCPFTWGFSNSYTMRAREENAYFQHCWVSSWHPSRSTLKPGKSLNKMSQEKLFRRDMVLFFVANFIWLFGLCMYHNFLPLYVKELGGNDSSVSIIVSIPFFAGFLAILGGFLDRFWDRKSILIFGWAITIPAAIIFAFASNWKILIIGQIIFSLTYICIPAATLYVFEYESPGKKHLAYSFIYSGSIVGNILSPSVGGIIIHKFGMQTNFLLVAILFLFSMICIAMLSEQKPSFDENIDRNTAIETQNLPHRKHFLSICLLFSAIEFSINIAEPYLSLFLNDFRHISVEWSGIAFTLMSLGSLIFTFSSGTQYVIKRSQLSISFGMLLFIVGIALTCFSG